MELDFLSAEAPNDKIEKRSNITLHIFDFSQIPVPYIKTIKHLKEREFHELKFRISFYSSTSVSRGLRSNKVYVKFDISADFKLKDEFCHYDFYHLDCFVSVIDNDGNKRFTRTFSTMIFFNSLKSFGHEYISQQTLLNDPSELLPNDILTLDIDIFFVFKPTLDGIKTQHLNNLIASSYAKDFLTDRPLKCNLFPNSEVAKTLCKVSTVFRDMFAYTAEDDSEVLEIPEKDASIFCTIFEIVKGVEYNCQSIEEVFEFLRVSDFYDISNMAEICRQYIKEFLSSKKLPRFLPNSHIPFPTLMEFAENCRDTTVLELIEAFIKSNSPSLDLYEEPDDDAWLYHLQWKYEQSLGFQLTVIEEEPKEDPDYSYFN